MYDLKGPTVHMKEIQIAGQLISCYVVNPTFYAPK